MYRIAICDDCPEDRNALERAVTQYFRRAPNSGCTLRKFSSGKELLRALAPYACDILLLDVELPGENGIEIAQRVRDIDDGVVIIFVSFHDEYVFSSFRAEPLRYLLKPLRYGEFEQAMDAAADKCKREHADAFSLACQGESLRIPLSAILYFESSGRVVSVVAKCETVRFYSSLNEVSAKLDPVRFMRCHQSYIVNLQYVRKVTASSVILSNRQELPVSRARKKSVSDAFMQYLGDLVL